MLQLAQYKQPAAACEIDDQLSAVTGTIADPLCLQCRESLLLYVLHRSFNREN